MNITLPKKFPIQLNVSIPNWFQYNFFNINNYFNNRILSHLVNFICFDYIIFLLYNKDTERNLAKCLDRIWSRLSNKTKDVAIEFLNSEMKYLILDSRDDFDPPQIVESIILSQLGITDFVILPLRTIKILHIAKSANETWRDHY